MIADSGRVSARLTKDEGCKEPARPRRCTGETPMSSRRRRRRPKGGPVGAAERDGTEHARWLVAVYAYNGYRPGHWPTNLSVHY